jgi:hypothetical protein
MRTTPFASLALILSLLGPPALAQSGFTLFGGEKDPENNLTYVMTNNRARARLNVLDLLFKPKNVAIAELQLNYTYFFARSFDTNALEIIDENTKQALPIETIEQDNDTHEMRIVLKKPVPAETPLRIRLQNFTNPRTSGIFKIQVRFLGTEPNPIYRYAGSWNLSFN